METRTLPAFRHLPAPPLPYPPRSLRRGPAAGRRRHREPGWSHPDGVQLLPRAPLPGTEPPGPRGTGLGAQGPQPEPQPGAGRGIPSVPYVPRGGRGPGPLREGVTHRGTMRCRRRDSNPGTLSCREGTAGFEPRDLIVLRGDSGILTPVTASYPRGRAGFEPLAPHCVPGGQGDSNPRHRIVSRGLRRD